MRGMLPKMKIKGFIAAACHACGLFRPFAFRIRGKAIVFMYHRILASLDEIPVFVQPGMYVLTETFRNQAEFLKKNFTILPLTELAGRIAAGQNVDGCCALTFDDGWRDNYTQAFPVIREFQVPATVFLTTEYVGTSKLFWPEELAFYLKQPGITNSAGMNQELDRFLDAIGDRGNNDETFFDNAIRELKKWTPREREEILSRLHANSTVQAPERQLMNWDEAMQMQASGLVSFGAHTANHVILDQVPLQQAEEEIVSSREAIEGRLGVIPEFFAYPNGNHTSELKTILKRQGFKGAVITRKGLVGQGCDLFEIPRIGMHEDVSKTIPLFRARMFFKRF